ncbi:MAG: hypothetical protein RL235_1172 [Chlamydiota bacterium]|jgi:mannose/fructose/N-acetylgalactosamine-specific phosphotransferase system component IIC
MFLSLKYLRKVCLAILGIGFAIAITSCNDKVSKQDNGAEKGEEKQERHSRRW